MINDNDTNELDRNNPAELICLGGKGTRRRRGRGVSLLVVFLQLGYSF